MKIQIFFISVVIISGTECILKKQSCKDINNKEQCINTDNPYLKCMWYDSCQNYSNDSCYQYFNQYDCQRDFQYTNYFCYWENGVCKKKIGKDEKCEDIDEYSNCSHQTGYRQLCAWKHGRCYSIDKCSQITDFWQCRNSYTRDRCQYVVNNVASNQEKEDLYIANVFNFNTCRNQDCVFNTHSDCPAFRNGRRCFFKQGECTQCSYQTNPSDCITTEKCTWQNSECQNIKCNQISSKRLCNQFSYCQYDFTTQQCQINKSSQGSHCYQNDIRSDPIKTKYNSFFGL